MITVEESSPEIDFPRFAPAGAAIAAEDERLLGGGTQVGRATRRDFTTGVEDSEADDSEADGLLSSSRASFCKKANGAKKEKPERPVSTQCGTALRAVTQLLATI